MFKLNRLGLLSVLFLILCISATGQEPMTQKQTRQLNKVRATLAHYDTGTKLDVRLNDGTHHIGKLTEAGSTSFVLIDSVSNTPQTVDYLDVKHVKASGNRQPGKSRGISHPVVDIALITLGLLTILVVR